MKIQEYGECEVVVEQGPGIAGRFLSFGFSIDSESTETVDLYFVQTVSGGVRRGAGQGPGRTGFAARRAGSAADEPATVAAAPEHRIPHRGP